MAAFNQKQFSGDLWKRGILFELVKADQSVQFFSLPFPPESFEIKVGQRVTRTKTFGGIFEDDYGLDNPLISIAGSMTGSDAWSYVDGPSATSSTSGEGAQILFGLYNKIIRYKESLQLAELGDYWLRVYFLWPAHLSPTAPLSLSGSEVLAYECSLSDFKLSQDKASPFTWRHNLELFAYRQLGSFNPPSSFAGLAGTSVPEWVQAIRTLQSSVNNLKAGFSGALQSLDSAIDTYAGYLSEALDLATSLETLPEFFASTSVGAVSTALTAVVSVGNSAGNLVTSPIKGFGNLVGGLATLGDSLQAIFNMPARLVTQTKGALEVVHEQLNALRASYDFTGNTLDPFVAAGQKAVQNAPSDDSYLGRYTTSVPVVLSPRMYSALCLGMIAEVQDNHNAWVEATKRLQTPAVPLGSGSANLQVYGLQNYPVKSGDSLESVANDLLGDPSWAYLLAVLNDITSLDDFEVGQVIKTPITKVSDRQLANRVYGPDNLGSDLALDSVSGDFGTGNSGDFEIVSGEKNMVQAVNNRLGTKAGTYLRNLAYGLRLEASIVPNILAANVKDALIQDPRILAVKNLILDGVRDSLFVTFEADFLGGTSGNLTGGISG